MGGGTEEHRLPVEGELREPGRHRVGELRGDLVHGPQVRGETRQRVQGLQQGDDLLGQGPQRRVRGGGEGTAQRIGRHHRKGTTTAPPRPAPGEPCRRTPSIGQRGRGRG
ncbi:hypothetical protein [Micromonospora sp. DH14]|uniref:hypothetical protein n=1 Tax=Micromonospora sp. DH14 TaxID=3040120 RepID=UPI002442FC68|nr:hypothetical protein [Micromonospora sp. DH14]MDG9677095.1 hypothetical protein [Micromonospora sp. DH14]